MCTYRDKAMDRTGELPPDFRTAVEIEWSKGKTMDEGISKPLENFSAAEVAPQGGAAVRGEAVAKCALPPTGWYCTRTAGHDGPCAAYPVNSTEAEHEAAILEVIDQRDKYHDMADQLAAQIAAMTEVEIGEHSSANEPWRNALIAGDEFIAAKFKAFCNGPVSARAADAPSEPSVVAWMRPDEITGLLKAAAESSVSRQYGRVYAKQYDPDMVAVSRAADALDSQPTEPVADVRARIADAVTENLRGLYYCGRVWSAWSVGTMGEDDFSPAEEDDDIIANITDAVMAALAPASSQPTDGGVRNGCDLKAVHAFLMGESPLEGVQFGDKHPTKAGAQWWRLNLRAALAKG